MNKERIRNVCVAVVFSLLLSATGVYVMAIKTPIDRLSMELRTATKFIGPSIANVTEGFFQSTFEKAFSDQFIKRNLWLKAYTYLEHKLNDISLPNKKPMTLVWIGSDVYTYPASEDYLTSFPLLKNSGYEQGIVRFTENVNAIAEKYQDVNVYVYKPFRLNESNWFDEDNNFTSYGAIYSEQFFNSLSDRVQSQDNQIDSFETYKEYYFKTDPHWNIFGSYEGYRQIVEMFSQNYDDMIPYDYEGIYTFEDFDFYGQYGRNSAYLTEADQFLDLEIDLPDYVTYVNGVLKQYDQKEPFKNGTIEDFYWNYIYSVYHGNDEAEVHFETELDTGRTLLAFVDSYSSPVKALIASHFDHAYFIDPRINPDFNFREFMEQHNVTDVLYLGFYGSLYSNEPGSNTDYVFEDY